MVLSSVKDFGTSKQLFLKKFSLGKIEQIFQKKISQEKL